MARNSIKPRTDGKTVALHNFVGINNIDPSDRLKESDLRDAVNVDVDRNGRLSRRPGTTQLTPTTTARSIWSDRNKLVLYADGNSLTRIKPNKTNEVLYSGISPTSVLCYQKLNERVFLSDGANTYQVKPDLSVGAWGLNTPSGWSALPIQGTACCGHIKISVTALTSDGEESGGSVIQRYVENGEGLLITAPPTAPEFVDSYNVYVSEPDGEALYLAGNVPAGGEVQTSGSSSGRVLETALLSKIPAGEHIAYYNGRLFVAKGSYVYYSEPLHYGLYNPAFNFFAYASDVTMLAATNNGVFVAADVTYKITGDSPDSMEQNAVFYYGSPKTEAEYVKATDMGIKEEGDCAVWLSDKGFAVATPSGGIINITEDRVAIPKYVTSAIMFRQRNGIEQVIATGDGGAASNRLSVSDSWGVEIRRNGVVIQE